MEKRLNRRSGLLSLPIRTCWGTFWASYSRRGLAELRFPDSDPGEAAELESLSKRLDRWHQLTARAIDRMLRGKRLGRLPPMEPQRGTLFQRSVWSALRQIPYGQTRTYGEIARTIGCPKSSRAVGQACGANPIPLLVPCHRVLAAGNRLGGFSAGLHWKRRLLELEGAV
jgi:O-6-methylguanine DNA methyltransferase